MLGVENAVLCGVVLVDLRILCVNVVDCARKLSDSRNGIHSLPYKVGGVEICTDNVADSCTELEQGFYHTETERTVPATEEERYTLGVDALRMTACEFVIAGLGYQFKWIAETDTADPYGKLYRALEVLRKDCGL